MVMMLPAWVTACEMFNASRDFHLAWELMGRLHPPPGLEDRVPWPLRAHAVCASIALELALKSRVMLEGRFEPKRTHSYHDLFQQLSAEAKDEIVGLVRVNGKPATTVEVENVLLRLDKAGTPKPGSQRKAAEPQGPFVAWRYMFDFHQVEYDEAAIHALTVALHETLMRLRPDWRSWPGIIHDSGEGGA